MSEFKQDLGKGADQKNKAGTNCIDDEAVTCVAVANAFTPKFYEILQQYPDRLHHFYAKDSLCCVNGKIVGGREVSYNGDEFNR